MVTLHVAKLTAGVLDTNWLTADYTSIEAKLDTWWTAIKPYIANTTELIEYRWYKDGPTQSPADRAPGPANPAVRTTARTSFGTGTVASGLLPPEVAISVTFRTVLRKRWGRVYLPPPIPFPSYTVITNEGRINSTHCDNMRAAMVTMLNAIRAAGYLPVVWSRGRSSHLAKDGSTIAAHTATAYEITSVQVDNLFDTIRSRRYAGPTYRTNVALT